VLGRIRDAIATGNGSPERYWRQVAASAITLLADYTWIHRIVESVEFLDESRVRRQVSVDLTLPPGLVRTRTGAAVVPLLVASKKVITALDLRGPDGATLPVLTRREHGLLATQILLIQAERKLRRSPREPVVSALEAVAAIGPSRDNPASTADAQLAAIRGGLSRRDRREFDGLEPDVWISSAMITSAAFGRRPGAENIAVLGGWPGAPAGIGDSSPRADSVAGAAEP
jgi:hypothetical protein